jgi:hypothetical protein
MSWGRVARFERLSQRELGHAPICSGSKYPPAVAYQTDGLDNQARNGFRLDWLIVLAVKTDGSRVLSRARLAVWLWAPCSIKCSDDLVASSESAEGLVWETTFLHGRPNVMGQMRSL